MGRMPGVAMANVTAPDWHQLAGHDAVMSLGSPGVIGRAELGSLGAAGVLMQPGAVPHAPLGSMGIGIGIKGVSSQAAYPGMTFGSGADRLALEVAAAGGLVTTQSDASRRARAAGGSRNHGTDVAADVVGRVDDTPALDEGSTFLASFLSPPDTVAEAEAEVEARE